MNRRTLVAMAVAALAAGTAAIAAGTTITLTASRTASTASHSPFDGTPAAGWPRAEAGIGTPKPASVDGWTEAQVADALTRVRAALVATRLDERMLVRHDPSAFLALLAPAQREQAKAQLTVVATRIDPAARLAAEPPRVRGRTTFKGVRDEYGRPALEVVTNHVWAYGFSAGSAPAVVHDEARWTFYQGTRVRSADSGMWLKQAKAYAYQMDCAAHRRGFLAPQAPQGTVEPSAAPADESFYDPDRPVNAPSTC